LWICIKDLCRCAVSIFCKKLLHVICIVFHSTNLVLSNKNFVDQGLNIKSTECVHSRV
jgi:hypothetical protein